MKKVVFLTPSEASPGFALAGVTHYTASSDEAEQLLKKVIEDPDTGVAVIDERLASAIDDDRFREVEMRWSGILLVLPSPVAGGEQMEEDYIERLVRRAIGYHVRLQT